MLGFAILHRDLSMPCRANWSLDGDSLKSQFSTSAFEKYDNYEKMDSTFQFHAKFHHIQTINDASNQIYLRRI